jgi:uncharacterized membrane protein
MFRFHKFKIELRLFQSLYLFIFGAQIGNSIAKRNYQQYFQENMCILRGSQEIMSILGLTFHVIIELLRVTIRPLTSHIEPNSFRTSW